MTLEKEKQGLMLNDYTSKLSDNKSYALRIGKEVPEGDVNLAYIHTPRVHSDENISLIDTSYVSDNVIPQDQLESMVVANAQGELEYADVIGNGEVRTRPPGTIFPSDKVNITKRFRKNEMTTENALYYKFEIDYHYDSKAALTDESGNYPIIRYTGDQIVVTDENGHALDDTYKYDIYVQAHPENPRIYSVYVYLNKNTNKQETFKIRYNHIDHLSSDDDIQSVQNSIVFYSNARNEITVDGRNKEMLEGGKLRIINGVSAYEIKTEAEVRSAMTNDQDKEIYAILPQVDGYKIIVPQKSESDPRVPRIFNHRVSATYKGSDGQTVKVSAGTMTDWVINPEALLTSEMNDYTNEWKNIGLPIGESKLRADEMIEFSLPIGTPSIPSDAQFYVEDHNGNLLYNITTLINNPDVDTQVNAGMSNTVEGKANGLTIPPWVNAMQTNSLIKNNAIPHRASIIPERQKTKWNFTFKVDGQGYTETVTTYQANWFARATVKFGTSAPITVDSPKRDVTLNSTAEKKLSNYAVNDLMEPLIKQTAETSYNGADYEVIGYALLSDNNDFILRIDDRTKFIYGQTNNPLAGGVFQTPWSTTANGLTVQGTGTVAFQADGHYVVSTNPSVLPTSQLPTTVKGFTWNAPVITSGSDIAISLNGDNIKVTATVPPITLIGTPYTLPDDIIFKEDGLKHYANLFGTDGFYEKLNIPTNIPKNEILLRIERGDVKGVAPDGSATVVNAENRVNYRFRNQIDGYTRLPVDQFQNQLGVNRLRLVTILNEAGEFNPNIKTDLIAWTTFRDLEAVPLFGIKIDEERKIEIEKPRVELDQMELDNWYLRIKNGRFLKRIRLPYIDPVQKIPEIYLAYPELQGMVTSPDSIVEVDLEYTVPEYTNQEFLNDETVLIDNENPIILNDYAIQTRYAPLILSSEVGNSYFEVYSMRAGKKRTMRIADVDAAKGIIYLLDRVREQDELIVRYAYKEDWYTYRGYLKESITPVSYPVVADRDVLINFDVTIRANMSYIDSALDVTSFSYPAKWCPEDKASYKNILLVYSGAQYASFTDSWNPHRNFMQMLANKGAIVSQVNINAVTLDMLKYYSFVMFSNMSVAYSDAEASMVQQYFAQGGSGMVVSEHSGLTQWYSTFDKIVQPWGVKTKPQGLVFPNGSFDANHPFTKDIANLQFSMNAASSIEYVDPTAVDTFKPLAYAPSGDVMASLYENGKQRIFLMGDSNFLSDIGIPNGSTMANGNYAFANKIVDNMTTNFDKIAAGYTSTDDVAEIRIFINTPYDDAGTGAYIKAFSSPASSTEVMVEITSMLKDAHKTGYAFTNGTVNTVIIEMINDKGAKDHDQFTIQIDC